MRYIVSVSGKRVEVDVRPENVVIDGRTIRAAISDVEDTPVRLVTIGDRVYRVIARHGAVRGEYSLWLDGFSFAVEALDSRTRAIRDLTAASARSSGPMPLLAPMPGLIVRVQVEPGDTVTAGQGLVMMEAMKMENELRSQSAGRVVRVLASAGMAVEKGAVLIELE